MTEPGRGRFLTFEGGDGSGKTTQMRLLAARLREQGREVVETVEPGGTAIGNQIRRILLDRANIEMCPTSELLLYFAARAQNLEELILPAVERGAIVLADRYTDSTLAYQGGGRGFSESVVLGLHQIACKGVWPELTLYIDVEPELGLARRNATDEVNRLDAEALEFHRRVRDAYLRVARREPQRVRVVDGRQDVETVAQDVWTAVEFVLP